jgi:DMSO/TMAO reductase YedYZ molybdopterin-dependent catalytic subunit
MTTALHPQTQLTFKYDGKVLPPKYGLSHARAHFDQARLVRNNYTGGYWEDEGYNWFSGV